MFLCPGGSLLSIILRVFTSCFAVQMLISYQVFFFTISTKKDQKPTKMYDENIRFCLLEAWKQNRYYPWKLQKV